MALVLLCQQVAQGCNHQIDDGMGQKRRPSAEWRDPEETSDVRFEEVEINQTVNDGSTGIFNDVIGRVPFHGLEFFRRDSVS